MDEHPEPNGSKSLAKRPHSDLISWHPSGLLLSQAIAEQLVEHAERLRPKACWGIITGQHLEAKTIHPLDHRTLYCWGAAPEVMGEILQSFGSSQECALAFYHSHSSEGGCAAIKDVPGIANWPQDIRHVLISLKQGGVATLQIFRREGAGFVEETSPSFSLLQRLRPLLISANGRSRRQRLLPPPSKT